MPSDTEIVSRRNGCILSNLGCAFGADSVASAFQFVVGETQCSTFNMSRHNMARMHLQ